MREPTPGAEPAKTPPPVPRADLAATDAEREAARLRYELNRLRAKRSVRAALLLGRGVAPRTLLATLRGTRVEADLDVLGPTSVVRRARYPHLRVGHRSPAPPFGLLAAPHVRVGAAAELADADVDLLVLDDLAHGDASALRVAARELQVPVVALVGRDGEMAAAAALSPDLTVVTAGVAAGVATPPGGPALVLPPWIDATVDNPIGWEPGPVQRREPATPDTDAFTREVLAAIARGVVVQVADPGVLTAPVGDLVVADAGDLADADAAERHSVRARREVLAHHDGLTRFEAVLGALGWPIRPAPRVSVVLATRRPTFLEHALTNVDGQDHPDVQLVVVLHGDDVAVTDDAIHAGSRWPTVVRRVPAQVRFGEALNVGLDAADGELVAKMDDDDHYGPRHLSDLLVALRYSGADVVGRWANEVHLGDADVTTVQDLDRQERWAHHLPGATMLAHADVLRALRFRAVDRAVDTHLLRALHRAGGSAYATHRFGFVRERHGEDHTFERSDRRFGSTPPRPGLDRSVLDV